MTRIKTMMRAAMPAVYAKSIKTGHIFMPAGELEIYVSSPRQCTSDVCMQFSADDLLAIITGLTNRYNFVVDRSNRAASAVPPLRSKGKL